MVGVELVGPLTVEFITPTMVGRKEQDVTVTPSLTIRWHMDRDKWCRHCFPIFPEIILTECSRTTENSEDL